MSSSKHKKEPISEAQILEFVDNFDDFHPRKEQRSLHRKNQQKHHNHPMDAELGIPSNKEKLNSIDFRKPEKKVGGNYGFEEDENFQTKQISKWYFSKRYRRIARNEHLDMQHY